MSREEEGRSIFIINFVNSRHVLQVSLHDSLFFFIDNMENLSLP
jgi:hypothetical protein